MKKYWKEITALCLEILLMYVFPLFAGPTDVMGMVVLMLAGTFVLGALLGGFSGSSVRFAFPPACALLFLPTIPMYYNFTALVHALWYLVAAYAGVGLGAAFRWIGTRFARS